MISFFIFFFVNTESISSTGSQMTDVKEKEAAQKCSFVTVYVGGSFACIGYIYSLDPQRVFAYRLCILKTESLNDKKYLDSIRVKATSDETGVEYVLGTKHYIVIFVSIYT